MEKIDKDKILALYDLPKLQSQVNAGIVNLLADKEGLYKSDECSEYVVNTIVSSGAGSYALKEFCGIFNLEYVEDEDYQQEMDEIADILSKALAIPMEYSLRIGFNENDGAVDMWVYTDKEDKTPYEDLAPYNESKKLIAEFMGVEVGAYTTHPDEGRTQYHVDDLLYDSSWDWLMPVIQKIRGMGFDFVLGNGSFIRRNYDYWETRDTKNDIEDAFLLAAGLIKWVVANR